jgi:hypothetical protein
MLFFFFLACRAFPANLRDVITKGRATPIWRLHHAVSNRIGLALK